MARIAVVLFNLGGPDSLEAVKPFLFNLFYDKAIIPLPNPLRYWLAKRISSKREKVAQEIYSHIGNQSPILEQTELQRVALKKLLGKEYEVFISMRYWNPRSESTVCEVKAYRPQKVILLPLYPQYSKTTTGSSFKEWYRYAQQYQLLANTVEVCCYPTDTAFIDAHVDLIETKLKPLEKRNVDYRILFSAHGLPKRNIKKGDPYQAQVEQTTKAVVAGLKRGKSLDWAVCYQSKVGNLEWIGPSLDDEIIRASADGKHVVVVPIAFVSEHSETLVELDVEYLELAKEKGCPGYTRVPTLSSSKQFIESLADLVKKSRLCSDQKYCPKPCGGTQCLMKGK